MSDYDDILLAVKHVPLPRQGYYNQNDGLWGKKKGKCGIREAKEPSSVPDHAGKTSE